MILVIAWMKALGASTNAFASTSGRSYHLGYEQKQRSTSIVPMVHPKPSQLEPILFISILARFTTLAVKIYICIKFHLECKLIPHLYFKKISQISKYTKQLQKLKNITSKDITAVSFRLFCRRKMHNAIYHIFFRFDYFSKCRCSQIHFLRENCFSPNFRVSFRASYGFPLLIGFGWVGHFGLQPNLIHLLATINTEFILISLPVKLLICSCILYNRFHHQNETTSQKGNVPMLSQKTF